MALTSFVLLLSKNNLCNNADYVNLLLIRTKALQKWH